MFFRSGFRCFWPEGPAYPPPHPPWGWGSFWQCSILQKVQFFTCFSHVFSRNVRFPREIRMFLFAFEISLFSSAFRTSHAFCACFLGVFARDVFDDHSRHCWRSKTFRDAQPHDVRVVKRLAQRIEHRFCDVVNVRSRQAWRIALEPRFSHV